LSVVTESTAIAVPEKLVVIKQWLGVQKVGRLQAAQDICRKSDNPFRTRQRGRSHRMNEQVADSRAITYANKIRERGASCPQ
jgi:hypothetical protein